MNHFKTDLSNMNLQLPTGKTISISAYDYYFLLKDEDIEEFFQSCIADNVGIELNNPFCNMSVTGHISIEELDEASPEENQD